MGRPRLPVGPRLAVAIGVVALGLVALPTALAATFERTGDLTIPRANSINVKLADGRVLIAGGATTGGETVLSAEIYDPATGRFALVPGLMVEKRMLGRGVLLRDGRVLIVGGQDGGTGTHGPRDTAELFDPATGRFTLVGDRMTFDRVWPIVVPLDSGKVLVSHGCCGPVPTADLYDPGVGPTGVFTPTAGQPDASFGNSTATATTLADGRVLIAGDWSDRGAQVYSPITGLYTTVGQTGVVREVASAALLPSGKVLIAGTDADGYENTAELFDPVAGTFSPVSATMSAGRAQAYSAVLPDGRVLIAGGASSWGGANTATADVYDPATGRFAPTAPMSVPRSQIGISDAIVLDDGCVLIAGGMSAPTTPDGGPTAVSDLFCAAGAGRIRIVSGKRTLTVRVHVPRPGALRQQGALHVARSPRAGAAAALCRSTLTVRRAGTVTIGCRLSGRAAMALRAGRLRLRVDLEYVSDHGATQTLSRIVRLARIAPGLTG